MENPLGSQTEHISVVIPFYNEQDNVAPLLTEVSKALQAVEHEIVAVDDGSMDNTLAVLQSVKKQLPALLIVRHLGNFGQSAAITSGVKGAQFEMIATLDGDGQNDPADIPALLKAVQEHTRPGKTVVAVGKRRKRQDNWLRRISSRIANNTRQKLLNDDCPDTGCGLKIFPKADFLNLPHFNHMHRFLPALFKRQGAVVINIPVNHRPRTRGKSKYGVGNRLWVGIVDIFGVRWLQRRPCSPDIDPEIY